MKKLLLLLLSITMLNAGIWRNNSDYSYRGYNGSDSTNGIIITSQNAVGIGTISPSTELEVSGNVTATTFIGAFTGTVTTANYATTANFSNTSITANYSSLSSTASYVTDINVVTNNYSSAVTLNNSNNILYGLLTGTASSANYAINSTSLNGEDASYYLDASNINSGILDKDYIDSEVVTQNYSGAVTFNNVNNLFYGDGSNLTGVTATGISGNITLEMVTADIYNLSTSITENVWIDVMYLDSSRTPGTGELSTTNMEYLSFDSGSSQNCKVQVEVPQWVDYTVSPSLVLVYTTSDNANEATINYTVSYLAVGAGESLTGSFSTYTDNLTPTGNSGTKFIDYIPMGLVSAGDSLLINFQRNDSDGYDDTLWVLNFGVSYKRKKL